ncbi:MAG: sulfite exporter TauE/SafE family protein [Candidatus Methanomethylophilus sp.]|jgi:uncharacterized membrane protein YfcA|nr:sulfite exporter TauE/SafE family protein [Methanomethylophilus sp.]MCI2075143.1 sulfite exporter TauE/SafE family protein [Methanomethylophilus sp.]MCI2092485.1 sulfite exporter TauE/SafE family protein [Methanomethylophilus sp.]
MEPFLLLVLMVIAVGAGIVGALFGLGGGIVFVPVLTILFGLDATEATAASLVGIVATSTGSATSYIRKGMSNVRLGMMMEITTTLGAVSGAIIAAYLDNTVLIVLFAAVMLYSGIKMGLSPERHYASTDEKDSRFTFSYVEAGAEPSEQKYTVQHVRGGMALCTVAGAVSSMTGIGGGSIKVPLMNIYMHLPIKVATATSNYMIGITAFSGAVIYFLMGEIILDVAAAVAIGAYVGARIGTRISSRINAKALKRYMTVVYFFIAAVMLCQAGGII